MDGGGHLRRMMRPAAAPAPLTPARALRLAAARAAERGAGLALAVLGVAEELGDLDDLLSRLEEGLLLVALDGGAPGLVALDGEGLAAVVEAQTLGGPTPRPAERRPPTAADLALARPFLDRLLAECREATGGTALDGWLDGTGAGQRLGGARDAGLSLPDGRYRVVRLTLDLGAGGRQGLLVLLARLAPAPSDAPAPEAPRLEGRVLGAKVAVEAVLHRVALPLAAVEALEPGQVLALPGVTVASVRLEGPGGAPLGPARLGQVAGLRAVRLEAPPPPLLDDGPRPVPLAAPA